MAFMELSLHVAVERGARRPMVRAWVDLDPDGASGSETELPLRRTRSKWAGTFAVSEPAPSCFLYRVALVAHAGAEWSLTIRDRDSRRIVFTDCDALAMAKGWLVGTCDIPNGWRAAAEGDGERGRSRSRGGHASRRAANVIWLDSRRR